MVTQVEHAEHLKSASYHPHHHVRSTLGVRGFRICESTHPLTSISPQISMGFPSHVQSREVFESQSTSRQQRWNTVTLCLLSSAVNKHPP